MRRDRTIEVRVAVAAAGAVVLLVPVALIGALVVGDAGWLHRFDLRVTGAVHGWAVGHPGWVRVMEVWSLVFDPNTWRVAALGLVIWLARHRAWPLAIWVAVTMTAGGVLGAVLKLLVGRHRPDLLDPVARAAGYSFPSGHALNNALAATVFLLVIPGHKYLKIALISVPIVTGLTRIGLGVHWTSDVVAGWLLGAAVTSATAAAYGKWRGNRAAHPLTEGLEPSIKG